MSPPFQTNEKVMNGAELIAMVTDMVSQPYLTLSVYKRKETNGA